MGTALVVGSLEGDTGLVVGILPEHMDLVAQEDIEKSVLEEGNGQVVPEDTVQADLEEGTVPEEGTALEGGTALEEGTVQLVREKGMEQIQHHLVYPFLSLFTAMYCIYCSSFRRNSLQQHRGRT